MVHPSHQIFGLVRLRKVRWEGQMVRMRKKLNAYKTLMAKS